MVLADPDEALCTLTMNAYPVMRSGPGRGGEPNSRRWTRLEDRRIVEIAFCRYDCVCAERCEVFFDAAIGAWVSIVDDGDERGFFNSARMFSRWAMSYVEHNR